ncbi:MAG: bifunctional 3-(3-hydroxy-phenyl)propionate/3-hydroxycinnamic acid hydroxylase [Acidimicrobiales bacterium]
MSRRADPDAEVTIVGYGPVGSSLAILLGQLGRSVVVVEKWPEPYPLPRAVHFDHEVGRILQACGIGDELRPIIEPADIYEWRNAAGTTLLRFGRVGDSPSGWPLSSMFNQPALEALLDRRAESLPSVEVRRGVEVDGLDQDDDVVTLRTAHRGDVRARYVVGCDGANSTVRTVTGLPMHDLGFFYDWLVVDVILDDARLFDPMNLQVCDPVRPTTVVSGGPGRRRWEFMCLPDESLEDLNSEQRAWELLGPWDVHPGNARLERHAVYTFRARYAERWRAGRVFVAGDAAHLTPPFAGQGMCAGLRDAANLAWKLDLVLTGHAPDALLDSYGEERLPSARAAIEFAMELGKVICVPDPAEAAARDEAMAAAVGPEASDVPPLPGLDHGIIDPSAPHAGQLFIQPSVDGRLLDDVHGAGWRLVTVDPDSAALDATALDWFESIGGRLVPLLRPGPVAGRWFADHNVTWALQRPDFYLYGTATNAVGASNLVRDVRSQLTPVSAPVSGGIS